MTGKNVWDAFKDEAGKHCVQRNSVGKRHTSMVSVGVLSLPPVTKNNQLPIGEFEITAQCGHGPGGQHQNKTQSACRAVHKPTGFKVFINGKHFHKNKEEAIQILTAKVNALRAESAQSAYNNQRKQQLGDGGRGSKVRTYNFIRNEIVDHRTNKATKNVKEFMKGNFAVLG